MNKISNIVAKAIRIAYDDLSIENDIYVEYISSANTLYGDKPQIYRIQMCFDSDYIFDEKVKQIVNLISKGVGKEPDKWTFDGVSEARIYWLDENAEEMYEKFKTE